MADRKKKTLFLIGFTAVFMGYLMVWLPGPSAGLQFLGFEMGEWSKFLGVGVKRNWFYLPPLTLAAMMLFFTVDWDNGRYQTWLFRGVAVATSLLAFPALEDLLGPSKSDYFSRVAGVGLVLLLAVAVFWLSKPSQLGYWGIAVAAFTGLLWPSLIFWEVRPFASQIMKVQLGIGPGFWLNLLGHAGVLILAVSHLTKKEHTKH
jgi:hypothetical protein